MRALSRKPSVPFSDWSSESFTASSAWTPSASTWGAGGIDEEGMSTREQRTWPRRSLRCPVQLIPLSGESSPEITDALTGTCLDFSEGGMYLTIPIGYGMAAGQRYIFRLNTRERGPEGEQVVLRQGMIIRAELLLGGDGHQVGLAVRFTGHRSGVVSRA